MIILIDSEVKHIKHFFCLQVADLRTILAKVSLLLLPRVSKVWSSPSHKHLAVPKEKLDSQTVFNSGVLITISAAHNSLGPSVRCALPSLHP